MNEQASPGRLPKLCLAASGGGHVRQILDLQPAWQDFPRVFVTEDTALGRSIGEEQPTRFVPHFALGQARLGSPFRMLWQAGRSIFASLAIVARERPDIVITTGAGSCLFIVLFARMAGARIILIDSFARFDAPSAFARLAGPLAHVRVAQSAASAAKWPGARMFDPFRLLEGPRPVKEPLLLATVGATLKFDRLVGLVAVAKGRGLLPERVIVQTGIDGARPEGVEVVESMPFNEMKELLARADIAVCHGGTGSLIVALHSGCRVIAVPRRFERGEHYDNHQAEIVATFASRGLLHVADTDEEFAAALQAARAADPVMATTDPRALNAFLQEEIAAWSARR